MTLRTHAYICLLTCSLSFLSLLICIDIVSEKGQMTEWLTGSLFACVGTFVCVRYLDRETHVPGMGDAGIGNSNFEKVTVTTSVWLPLILSGFAILAILYVNENFQKLAWILIALAGNTGLQSAKLYDLESRK